MRVYSYNTIPSDSLGMFQGIDKDGIVVKMKLEGNNLSIVPVEIPQPIVKEPERTIPTVRRRTSATES